jgi:hypothetical protein
LPQLVRTTKVPVRQIANVLSEMADSTGGCNSSLESFGGRLVVQRLYVCIGAALTLMEAEVILGELMRRWPTLALSQARPRWNRNPVYRGLETLQLDVPMPAPVGGATCR